MSSLIPTTSVTIARPSGDGDPYEAARTAQVARGVRAHVSGLSPSSQRTGGAQQVVDATLFLDVAVPLRKMDRVTDEVTGETYTVTWAVLKIGLGLDYQKAGLVRVDGGARG